MDNLLNNFAERPIARWLMPVLIGVGVVAVYWQPLHLDLWNDEVYSLLRFQQVPLLQTLTDYHETNNHIFFNFLLNIYLRLIGSPAAIQVFQHPEIVRLVPLLFTLITYLVLYRWMRKMYSPWLGLTACVLLTATLPYYNFALQYRAYSLVMMLGTIYGYTLWRYLQIGGLRKLWTLPVCAALIFYSHPAGIYLVIALAVATAMAFSVSLSKAGLQRQRSLYAACTTAIGGIIGGLAYLPVLRQLLSNPWVAGHKISGWQFLRDKFLSCSYQLFYPRFWILVIAAAGIIACILSARKKNAFAKQACQWMLYCGIVYCLTFLIPLLRHDDAPQRTFTMLIPFVVVGLTIALNGFAGLFRRWKLQQSIVLVVALVLTAEIPFQIAARNSEADKLVAGGHENASLLNGYYLHHFAPLNVAGRARELSVRNHMPVYYATVYLQEMPHYLVASGMPLKEYRTSAQHYSAPDSFYVVTAFPSIFRRLHAAEIHCMEIPLPLSFYYLLFATKLKQPVASS